MGILLTDQDIRLRHDAMDHLRDVEEGEVRQVLALLDRAQIHELMHHDVHALRLIHDDAAVVFP